MVNEVSRVGVVSRPHSEEIHYPSARHNENYEEIVRIKNMCRSALSPDNIQGNPAKALNYKPNESKYYGTLVSDASKLVSTLEVKDLDLGADSILQVKNIIMVSH